MEAEVDIHRKVTLNMFEVTKQEHQNDLFIIFVKVTFKNTKISMFLKTLLVMGHHATGRTVKEKKHCGNIKLTTHDISPGVQAWVQMGLEVSVSKP